MISRMGSDVDLDLYWILRGSQRVRVLRNFGNCYMPSEMQKLTRLPFSNVSRVLGDMRVRGIIELSDDTRLYSLTEKGRLLRNRYLRR